MCNNFIQKSTFSCKYNTCIQCMIQPSPPLHHKMFYSKRCRKTLVAKRNASHFSRLQGFIPSIHLKQQLTGHDDPEKQHVIIDYKCLFRSCYIMTQGKCHSGVIWTNTAWLSQTLGIMNTILMSFNDCEQISPCSVAIIPFLCFQFSNRLCGVVRRPSTPSLYLQAIASQWRLPSSWYKHAVSIAFLNQLDR